MASADTKHLDKAPSEVDWARLAAYIDGEGCIYIAQRVLRSGSVNTFLAINVTNSDPRLIKWITQTFVGHQHTCKIRPTRVNKNWASQMYQWACASQKAQWILEGCLPFFIIKREQAEIGLAHQSMCGYRGCATRSAENIKDRLQLRDELSTMKGQASRRKILTLVERNQEKVA